MATHSSIFSWRGPWATKSWTPLSDYQLSENFNSFKKISFRKFFIVSFFGYNFCIKSFLYFLYSFSFLQFFFKVSPCFHVKGFSHISSDSRQVVCSNAESADWRMQHMAGFVPFTLRGVDRSFFWEVSLCQYLQVLLKLLENMRAMWAKTDGVFTVHFVRIHLFTLFFITTPTLV